VERGGASQGGKGYQNTYSSPYNKGGKAKGKGKGIYYNAYGIDIPPDMQYIPPPPPMQAHAGMQNAYGQVPPGPASQHANAPWLAGLDAPDSWHQVGSQGSQDCTNWSPSLWTLEKVPGPGKGPGPDIYVSDKPQKPLQSGKTVTFQPTTVTGDSSPITCVRDGPRKAPTKSEKLATNADPIWKSAGGRWRQTAAAPAMDTTAICNGFS
jgi:hypothetical protein